MELTHNTDHVRFTTYSKRMIEDPAGIAEELRQSAIESGIEFDTIVGRGSSGMLIVPIVAHILGKRWFIIRKDEEVNSSHDSGCKWMGELGKRWIFLDDFCSSGQTFRKVRDGIRQAVERATRPTVRYEFDGPKGFREVRTPNEFETELVGYYEYESRNENGRMLVPWDENATPGYNDMFWDDTPRGLADRARRDAERDEAERVKGEQLQAEADRRAEEAIDGSVYTVSSANKAYAMQLSSYAQASIYSPPTVTDPDFTANTNCYIGDPNCNCKIDFDGGNDK